MQTLHALWWPGYGLALWGEDADRPVKSSSEALRQARPHTFAATAEDLGFLSTDIRNATVALPSVRTAPLDSPQLLRATPRPQPRGVSLLAWSVPVALLSPEQALTWLIPGLGGHGTYGPDAYGPDAYGPDEYDPDEYALSSNKDHLRRDLYDRNADTYDPMTDEYDVGADGIANATDGSEADFWFESDEPSLLGPDNAEIRLGDSVDFFRTLAVFALDLVERGQFLPTIVTALPTAGSTASHSAPPVQSLPDKPVHQARWRSVLQGSDARFAASLTTTLPAVARALVGSPRDLSGQAPAAIVDEALDALVDAAVRRQLRQEDIRLETGLPTRRGRRPAFLPAEEAFAEALSGADPVIQARPGEIAQLSSALASWDEIGRGHTSGAHLLLRLVEPTTDPDDPWQLTFSLQSAEDDSLIVPAAQIWQAGASLDRWLERADQTLLAELGRAAKLWPVLVPALRQSEPSQVLLNLSQVHAFLTEAADNLRQNDIAVFVPNWWGRRRIGLSGYAAPEPGGPTEGMLTRDTLCDFSWRLAVGETVLDDDEIEALAQSKASLIHLRGGWVAFDAEQVRRGLEFLRAQAGAGPKTVGEVIALALGQASGSDLPVIGCEATGVLGDLLNGSLEARLTAVSTPTWFAATLRPYQERGLSWLAFLSRLGLGACLADDMGLGKTVQLLALEAYERKGRKRQPASLLICPVSVVGNWQAETARFAPKLKVVVHYGRARPHGQDFRDAVAKADLVITTYQVVTRDLDELKQHHWRRVILDEAQLVKNAATRGARAVRQLPGEHRVALTGTPVENKLAELRSVMDFLNPGILGSPEEFRSRFARPIETEHAVEPANRLRAITRPFILRRVKTDKSIISDLPEKTETKQICLLTPEQASLYSAVVAEMMAKIESSTGIERRGNVLAAMTKLKQICNHPAQFLHDGSALRQRSGKIERLDQIVEEILAENEKALIFTQFTEFGDMLLRHLSARFNRDVAYLHGSLPASRRQELVRTFQGEGGPDLFLLSLRAGGTGLNLTAASHVIHIDRWWNPAVENQATDRAYRIGQERPVQVHSFICRGTLEERIDAMIEQKKALADLVVGQGESWLTELGTDELRSVFALSREAFDD